MISKPRKLFIPASILMAALGADLALSAEVRAAPGPGDASALHRFYDDARLNASLNFWLRRRDRANFDSTRGQKTAKIRSLDHGSGFFNVDFRSGYIHDVIGLDLGAYATFDMWQNGRPDHNMNFWNINNPFEKRPGAGCSGALHPDCAADGVSIATAHLKFKYQDRLAARLGYFQPSAPSALGADWSFTRGVYLGGELGLILGQIVLGLAYATEYRAPWFKRGYKPREKSAHGARVEAGDMYSVGMRYAVTDSISLELAYGALTRGQRKNAHLKLTADSGKGWRLSPQIYFTHDAGQYSKSAWQLAFIARYATGPYTFRAESTYTLAENRNAEIAGHFAYRLTQYYGGSRGAYDIWWDSGSDFNHDNELALFGAATRDLSDWGLNGLSAGINGVYGFGARAPGHKALTEYALSLFIDYRLPGGALKNMGLSLYCTWYQNEMNAGNYGPYSNAFQDETNFKFIVTLPFSIK